MTTVLWSRGSLCGGRRNFGVVVESQPYHIAYQLIRNKYPNSEDSPIGRSVEAKPPAQVPCVSLFRTAQEVFLRVARHHKGSGGNGSILLPI